MRLNFFAIYKKKRKKKKKKKTEKNSDPAKPHSPF